MKALAVLFACLFLGACASPYYPIYSGGQNDYYIAAPQNYGTSYGRSSSLGYVGVYPWWEFSYFSPYFYPHHFNVWQPAGYHNWYSWYGGYYPYWCPPYTMPRHLATFAPAAGSVGSPVEVPRPTEPVTTPPLTAAAMLRDLDEFTLRRESMQRLYPSLYQRGSAGPYAGYSAYGRRAQYDFGSTRRMKMPSMSRSSAGFPTYSGSGGSTASSVFSSSPSRVISSGSRTSPSVRDH